MAVLLVTRRKDVSDGLRLESLDTACVLVKELAREEHSRCLLLQHQHLPHGIGGYIGVFHGQAGRLTAIHRAKQIQLPFEIGSVLIGQAVDHALVHGEQLRPVGGERIKRPRLDQRLHLPLVDIATREPLQKILKGGERTAATLLQNGFDKLLTYVLEGKQTVADMPSLAGLRGVEGHLTFVYIGRQNANVVACTLRHVLGHLGMVAENRRQKRGEIGPGMVSLEIGRAVGDQRIGRRVGLVKGVIGKAPKVIKERLGPLAGHAVFYGSRNEILALSLQHRRLLLGHGAAHDVGMPIGVASQHAEDAHDLLLVHRHTKGGRKNRFKER